ncbi:MAG: sugar kinase [Verrucomicrobia bacterium]|nr:sugar kinase [Verrucomicrobiota bacterium]
MKTDTPRFVLVTRRTRLQDLIARFNTIAQARFYVEHLGADFADYEREHATYEAALRDARAAFGEAGRLLVLDRAYLPNYVFGPEDHVAALGQDGLVANVLKYVGQRPLLGLNPDPERWDGVLLPFRVDDLRRVLPRVLRQDLPSRSITFAAAELNTGQTLLAVNDLFIGARTHVSARYEIRSWGQTERQSSSGVIVSTGLGSTGWLRSIEAGAAALAGRPPRPNVMTWDSPFLIYSVREPFPSRTTGTELVSGPVTAEDTLEITSAMADQGVIFSDGMEADFLAFNSGTKAVIRARPNAGRLWVRE